ncbi:hypothetical protein CTAYLR_008157 [Chrysophaeum taylorii]|uniref:ABC transporter domain-containing protein n=1 Tax=Chrysophaeum taylorii TaxID=2483200 RepID=A0AAD7XPF4_9STRA|nr:hypothetical protein CTAYLR_008157 [Chrysophaeum taylorii]
MAVFAEVLAGLDEELVEYISGLVEDAEDDEVMEQVAEFLLSAEYCADEAAAASKVSELWRALGRDQKKKKNNNNNNNNNNNAAEEVCLPKISASSEVVAAGMTTSNAALLAARDVSWDASRPKVAVNQTTSSCSSRIVEGPPKQQEQQRRRPEKEKKTKNTRKAAEKTRQVELRAEMEAAKERSVRERWRSGGFKGAIEAKSFTLANPGGGRDLLEEAGLALVRGRRYALVGRNGKGKSTLLQALAARRVGDIPVACSVHYASQDVTLSEEEGELRPVEVVARADVERRVLLEDKARGGQDARELELTLERLELCAGAEERAETLLADLGFSKELRSRPMKALSGGWRVRTFLAAALFSKPDLLLLDEPTNHLSISAVLWLAEELTTSPVWADRIVVVVSHDRVFLEDVCTDVLHISGAARRLTQTHGSYRVWAARRAEQKLAWDRERSRRRAEIDKLDEYAGHGFRYGGSSSQIAKMKMKERQADKLRAETEALAGDFAALQEDAELPITLRAGGTDVPGNLVSLRAVGFAYPGAGPLFLNAELAVRANSRIVFVGENGNGKTTLVKLILGLLDPTRGEVLRSPHARLALVNQHHADQIDLSKTPLDFMRGKFPGDGSYDHDLKLRAHLASCGVTGTNPDLQNVPASALSGGQRSRVALAAVSYVAPHVLVLDEPTNNLDLESVAALADCVRKFEGAVVCVSHDIFFVSQVADECWVVAKNAVKKAASFQAYVDKHKNQSRKHRRR